MGNNIDISNNIKEDTISKLSEKIPTWVENSIKKLSLKQ